MLPRLAAISLIVARLWRRYAIRRRQLYFGPKRTRLLPATNTKARRNWRLGTWIRCSCGDPRQYAENVAGLMPALVDWKLWPPAGKMTTLRPMDTTNLEAAGSPRSETVAAKRRRTAWEAARIAEARASGATGRVVSSEAVDAWIDSLGTDHELPPPRSGR